MTVVCKYRSAGRADLAVARILAASAAQESLYPRLLEAIGESLRRDFGAWWEVSDNGTLRCIQTWRSDRFAENVFDSLTRDTVLESGVGLPGRVRATGKPAWIADMSQDPTCPRAAGAASAGLRSSCAFPVHSARGALGAIELFAGCVCEPDEELLGMMTSLGSQLGQLIERQHAERAVRAELRASRARIVDAADETRRRLERDLHDGAQARLVNLGLALRLARAKLAEPDQAALLLDEAIEELAQAASELREFARGIHPAVLTEGGLAPALRTLVACSRVPVQLGPLPTGRFPRRVEATAYFVVAEALANVARYSNAKRGWIDVGTRDRRVSVEVGDDGCGGAEQALGSGLRGLADRVAALDGSFEVISPAGIGTIVRAVIPCG